MRCKCRLRNISCLHHLPASQPYLPPACIHGLPRCACACILSHLPYPEALYDSLPSEALTHPYNSFNTPKIDNANAPTLTLTCCLHTCTDCLPQSRPQSPHQQVCPCTALLIGIPCIPQLAGRGGAAGAEHLHSGGGVKVGEM